MPEQRHLYRVGTSTVVAIPPRVRKHLGVKRGDEVYWHAVRGAEAVLTMKAERDGGRPEGLKLARLYEAALREIERLHRERAARDQAQYNEGFSVGYQLAQERAVNIAGPSAQRQRARERAARRMPPAPTHQRAERRRRARARDAGVSIDTYPPPP